MSESTASTADPRDREPFLLIAWTMPPTACGMGVVTRNLASGFPPEEVVIIGQVLPYGEIPLTGIEDHHRVQLPRYELHWRIRPWLEPLYVIPSTIIKGCAAVRKYKLRAVVASYPSVGFLVAGLIISMLMRVPYFPYYHNLYVETRETRANKLWARPLHWMLNRFATRVLSMSQGMSDFHRERYRIESTPILHTVTLPIPAPGPLPEPRPPYRLAFTGNINYTVEERIRQVIDAVGGDPDYEIVLHSPVPEEEARKRIGTWAENVTLKDVPDQADLVASLRECDVMMLALADRRGHRLEDDFMTQFPTRTLELLLSERPILVLSPDEYFISRFFRENDCGHTLSDESAEALRSTVHTLCTDTALRERYVANALGVAQNYRVDRVANALREEFRRAGATNSV